MTGLSQGKGTIMDFTALFMGLLFAALIYLHIRQSDLIFQHDIKIAKILASILLCIVASRNCIPLRIRAELISEIGNHALVIDFISSAVAWVLIILIYWKILASCYIDAFFKKIGKPGQSLREKIKDIVLEAIQKDQRSPALKLFLKTRFEDPAIDSVRCECKDIIYAYTQLGNEDFPQEQLEKLKSLAEKLG